MLPIPIGTDRPQRQFPWMNVLLIAANVLLYFWSQIPLGPVPQALGMPGLGATGGLGAGWERFLLYPEHPRLEQFITYQFLHAGLWHLAGNMLFLYVFGNSLNEKLGHVAYLAFYLTGGVLAGCGHVLTSAAPTLGASGSISAVTGMFLVLLPRTHIRMFVWLFVYVDVWEIPSMYFILFKVGQDVVEPMLGSSSVAHTAHLSGYLSGFVLGWLLLLTRLVQRDHYDLLSLFARWKRRREYQSLVAGGYDPFGPTSGAGTGKAGRGPPVIVNPQVTALREQIGGLLKEHRVPEAAAKYLALRALDPRQVLSAQDQLDVANQLMSEAQYPEAAAAYEDYLRVYPTGTQVDQVMLILGIIYARYAPDPARAVQMLQGALGRLHDQGQRELAEAELLRLEPGAGT
jgi:membrane associated rhomboid family serine protease